MSEVVSLTFVDQIARVQINRAASLNALDKDVLEALRQTFQKLQSICQGDQAYQQCRAVVLSSEGEKAFVAGADIKLMQSATVEQLQEFINLGQEVMREIEQTPLPVIAMVQGFAIGGGMELAMSCDLIVASEKAKFGQAEVNLGLIPGFGGSQRLAARCGAGTAKRLVLTGQNITAIEAQRLGIVDWLVTSEELESTTLAIAKELAAKGPLALAAGKRAVDAFFDPHKLPGLENEVREFVEVFSTEDAKEGLNAFVEKRAASFKGH